MDSSALPSTPAGESAPHEWEFLRELGRRGVPTFAARLAGTTEGELVVVDRIARGGLATDGDIAEYVRSAQRVALLQHRNVVRARGVTIEASEVRLVSDFVDGETYSAILAEAPLGVRLRILADALAGLTALHGLRGPKGEALGFVHGDLLPMNLMVGLDGVTRIARAGRVHVAAPSLSEADAVYLAPEILLADRAADARADVYGVGVLLWEALAGKPPFPATNVPTILAAVLANRTGAPPVPSDAPWAKSLAELARRAIAARPSARPATASTFEAEMRIAAGPQIATTEQVAAFVKSTFGARIAERRATLVAMPAIPRTAAEDLSVTAVLAAPPARASDRPTVPMPAPVALSLPTPLAIPSPIPSVETRVPTSASPASTQRPEQTATAPPRSRRNRAWVALVIGAGVVLLAVAGLHAALQRTPNRDMIPSATASRSPAASPSVEETPSAPPLVTEEIGATIASGAPEAPPVAEPQVPSAATSSAPPPREPKPRSTPAKRRAYDPLGI